MTDISSKPEVDLGQLSNFDWATIEAPHTAQVRPTAGNYATAANPPNFAPREAADGPSDINRTAAYQRAVPRRVALSRWRRRFLVISLWGDVGLALVFVTAGLQLGILSFAEQFFQIPAVGIVALLTGLWMGALWIFGAYNTENIADGIHDYKAVLFAGVAYALVILLAGVAFQIDLPPELVVITFPALIVGSVVTRLVARRDLTRRRVRGLAAHRTLIVGDERGLSDVVAKLNRDKRCEHKIVGVAVPERQTDERAELGALVLGRPSDVARLVRQHDVDTVLVTGSWSDEKSVRKLFWELEGTNAAISLLPALHTVVGPTVSLRAKSGMLMVRVGQPRMRMTHQMYKKAFDRALGLAILLLLSPLLLVAALAVKMDSKGPVLYRQTRIGKYGQHFEMLKLRSMHVDADLLRTDDSSNGYAKKQADDPRITRVGAFIRRYSIDELPQILNVVRGDMSLVGPRPSLPREYGTPTDGMHRRLSVLPGMTGLWQVSGRSDLSWDDAVQLDSFYVDNWSAILDLQIMARTINAVFAAEGSY